MLKAIQCMTSSVVLCSAVSGSITINTKVAVLGGTLVHSNFGETGFGSAWENLLGITAPSANAGLESVSPGVVGAGGGACAMARLMPAVAMHTERNSIGFIFMIVFLPFLICSIVWLSC